MLNMLLLAAVTISTAAGWLESAYAEFPLEQNTTYHAYVQQAGQSNWTKLDDELVRDYGTYGRVDALGLSAGQYQLKVVPVRAGAEVAADAAITAALTVAAHDRNGFAHADWNAGVGAYNNDGTLKTGAKVIYVSNANVATVEGVGLQRYIESIKKGPATPVCIRILGTLDKSYLDSIGSKEGLQIKGSKSYTTMNMTIEGVGRDAAIQNFGMMFRNCTSIEVRNLAVIFCMDDCIGFDTDNSHGWIHHCDFFYGQPGSAADQAKGDGTCDMKAGSKYLTFSYNHFWDSGKSSLCGMKEETKDSYITYHHNHFDHSDSRHPRIRTMSVHIYNNYYDGNAKYGVGLTKGASAFVENNYFRACKHPILSAGQGTDAQGEGTFSGEDGGICKAYNNYMTASGTVRYYNSQYGNNSDAYLVTNRQDTIPASVVTIQGNEPYNNFDKYQPTVWAITPDSPDDAKTNVLAHAGRCQKGDISFTFTTADDTSSDINAALKTIITNYRSSLVRIVGGDTIPTEPQEKPQPSGEGNYECWFTANGPSSGLYIINGGQYSKDKGSVAVTLQSGNDTTLAYCLKSEGSYQLSLTLEEECSLQIIFGGDGTNAKAGSVKIDGTKYTATNQILTRTLTAGTHTIEKADACYIYYMLLTPTGTGVEDTESIAQSAKCIVNGKLVIRHAGRTFDISGRHL